MSRPNGSRISLSVHEDSSRGHHIPCPRGLPLFKPPYGRLVAIDLNRGEILWTSANGDGPRDHPAIAHLDLPPLGQRGARRRR